MKPLARAIVDFRMALAEGDLILPADVAAVMQAVDRAMRSPAPQTAINRSFANLRRRPRCFYHLHIWLQRPEVQHVAATGGAHWAWLIWCKASIEIHNDVRASDAFSMDLNGRPKGQGFTRADDAAMYAALQARKPPTDTVAELISTAATLYDARPDEVKKAYGWAELLSTGDLESAASDRAKKRR